MKLHRILRRGLCLLLSALMILTVTPVTAFAEEPQIITTGETTPDTPVIITTDETMSGEEGASAGETTSEGESNSDEDTTSEEEESASTGETTSKEAQSIVICGTTPEEGKAYIANTAEIGGIAQRTEETDYFEYADGVLTIYGNVVLTQPADTVDNVLKLEGDDLTINCPEGCSLTLDGQNSVPTVFLQNNRLTFNGTGDLIIKGSEKPVSEGMFMVANAKDVTIIGTNGAVLPKDSNITATGNVYIESTNNVVVDGLFVNNAQKVTLKGNTTDSVAMNVTFNNCGSWNIINENQDSTAPLAIQLTVDGITYDSYYGTELAEDETGTEADTVSVDGASNVAINATNFPDDSFRAYIEEKIDTDGDKSLSDEEIAACTYINVSYCNVKSLKGIEYFTNLYSFYCNNNQLTTIDVSKNTALQYFECNNNQLTTIDVSKNTWLMSLCFNGNQLTTIDVSKNTALGYIHCNDNQLTTINISNNKRLYSLKCENNKLTTIDVSKNTALESLYCSGNNLTELNVSNNPELAILYCGKNQLTELNFSNNPKLYDLSCHDNQLLSLDASGKSRLSALDISNNPNLTTLNCSNANLSSFIISGDTELKELYCANNRLTTLDLSNYTALTTLDCQANMLTVLDLSNNKELTTLNCQGNWLTALDLSGTSVTEPSADNNTYVIDLDENRAFSLSDLPDDFDVTKASNWKGGKLNTQKTILTFNQGVDTVTYSYNCGNSVTVTFTLKVDDSIIINETNFPDANFREKVKIFDKDEDNILNYYEIHSITKLDVSYRDILSLEGIEYFTNLKTLYCRGNTITTLDLSKNSALVYLDCYNTGLTKLDLSNCTALETVDCSFNNLTTIVFKNNIKLKELNCYSNALSTVDLSSLTALETVKLTYNGLTTLDVSKNSALVYLDCIGNNLTALDVSKNTALESLDLCSNQLKTLNISNCTALGYLDCSRNQLTTLDVSKNTKLYYLDCGSNQLTTLDVSKNIALLTFYCNGNPLTALDTGENTVLTRMSCTACPLKTLDVSKNTALIVLSCSYCSLTSLDVSKNTALQELNCEGNSLTTLDISLNSELYRLTCGYNNLTSLDLSNNNITNLSCVNNYFKITPDENSSFDLSTLPGNFDFSKTSNWQGGTVNENTMILTLSEGSEIVTYDYDCGKGSTVKFTLREGGIDINATNFPDEMFRLVAKNIDKDNNNILTANEIAAVEELELQGSGIESLKGIEYFTSLKFLDCSRNKLTTLDLSNLTALEELYCTGNPLTTMDVSNCTALKEFYCYKNQLTTLDVSGCTALTKLYCHLNQLPTLDVSDCTALQILDCQNNQLTKLDVSKNAELFYLDCCYNKLSAINVTNNSRLQTLNCIGNRLTTLDVTKNARLISIACSENKLTKLDLSKNYSLQFINCKDNKLTTLKLGTHSSLSNLMCSGNKLKTLDVSGCGNLLWFDCSNNNLTSLNLGRFFELKELDCSNNKLTSLKVSQVFKASALEKLDCSNNKLTELNLLNNVYLKDLDCSNNNLASLEVSQVYDAASLEKLDCSNNKLTELSLINNDNLKDLDCSNNNLTFLKVSSCIKELNCSNNKLTILDFSYDAPINVDCSNNELKVLILGNEGTVNIDCSNNNLQKLDLRRNKLKSLDCSNNDITELNLDDRNSSEFTSIDCSNNNLSSLDFSYSTKLSTLNCDNNNLSSLDLSKCVALETFSATGNVYTITTDENRSCELSSLPGTFDVTKASNIKGGTINEEQTVLTVNDKTGMVTYDYDCGNSYSVKFTLKEMQDVALNSTNFPNRIFLAYAKTFDKDGNNKLSPAEIGEVTQIDVSGLNINNFKGIEHFFALESLNLSGNTSIKALNLSEQKTLTSIDASGCTKLSSLTLQPYITSLNISNTNLNNFDFYPYQKLEVFDISGLQMPKILDMTRHYYLTSFKASGCGLENIVFLRSYDIETLDLSNNHLVSLSISSLHDLKSINVEGNTRNIGTIYNGEYDLTKLKETAITADRLSIDRILEVKGATLDRESGKLTNIEGTTVTYVYDTQNNYVPEAKSVEFTLIIDRNMTVNYEVCTKKGSDGVYCETWEEVLAAMNDKTKDYYVYLHNDVEVDKFTFPSSAKAKSVTLLPKTEGDVKTITMKAASVSLPIDVSLENICIESTAENGFSIAANKNLSLNEFRSASLILVKGGSKSALVYTGSEDKTITTDYRIEGFGNVELNGKVLFNNTVKANNLVLNDASTVYTGAYSVSVKTITAKNDTAIRYNTADFIPVTVNGTVNADAPITLGFSDALSDLKFSENRTVLVSKSAELSVLQLDEGSVLGNSETGYVLGRVGANVMVLKGVFALSYNAGGTDYANSFAKWTDVLNQIAYQAKLDKATAQTTTYTIEVLTDTNIAGALTMPKAGTFKSLMIKGKTGSDIKTLTFIGTTISVTGTTTIDNLILNSVKKNTDKSVDFNFSAGKNSLYLRSVSGKIKDVKASGDVWLNNVTINGNVSANNLFALGTAESATISKTSVTIGKNLNVKGTLTFSGDGSVTVKGGFFAGGLASTVSEDQISLVLYQNVKKPAVIGKVGFASYSKQIRFALVDSAGNPVSLTDNMVIASISCAYTDMLIPCSENLNGTDYYIMKEKNKLVAKPKKDTNGNAIEYLEVNLNDKTAYYLSLDSAIKDINAVGKKTDDVVFFIRQEMFSNLIAKLPLPKAGKYQTLTYKTADEEPVTIQIKGDLALTGNLTISSDITVNKVVEIKLIKRYNTVPISINVGSYEFHASKLSYDTKKSESELKNVSGKGICSVAGDILVSGKVTVKTFDVVNTVTLSDTAAFASNIITDSGVGVLKYSSLNVKNVKLGKVTNVAEGYFGTVSIRIDGLKPGDKIATLTGDYIMDSVMIDDTYKYRAVRSKNALVVAEYDKSVELYCENDYSRVYDSYESAITDITRLKNATGVYRIHMPEGNYEWAKLLLPAKGKYSVLEIGARDTAVISVKCDVTLTGDLAIGQNTTLRKVNADGSVAEVFNFISPKDKQGKPVYSVQVIGYGKIINGKLNGENI